MTPKRGENGFALLIVLWTVVVLTVLTMQVTQAGRSEAQVARNLRNAAVLQAAADGAVAEAAFHWLDLSERGWRADAGSHRVVINQSEVDVRIESEAGKINPNLAPAPLLQALIMEVGAGGADAASLANAIVDWRTPDVPGSGREAGHAARLAQYRAAGRDYGPPGAPIQSLDELHLILGMTPLLVARLKPHLSVWNDGEPDLARATPVVLQALREANKNALPTQTRSAAANRAAVAITAEAIGDDGGRFTRQAIIRRGDGHAGFYDVLTWDAPLSVR